MWKEFGSMVNEGKITPMFFVITLCQKYYVLKGNHFEFALYLYTITTLGKFTILSPMFSKRGFKVVHYITSSSFWTFIFIMLPLFQYQTIFLWETLYCMVKWATFRVQVTSYQYQGQNSSRIKFCLPLRSHQPKYSSRDAYRPIKRGKRKIEIIS